MTHSFSSHATVAPDVLFRLVGDEAVRLQEYDIEPARLREGLDSFSGKLSEQGLSQVGQGER